MGQALEFVTFDAFPHDDTICPDLAGSNAGIARTGAGKGEDPAPPRGPVVPDRSTLRFLGLGLHAAASRVRLPGGLRVLLVLLGTDASLDLVAEILVDVAPV